MFYNTQIVNELDNPFKFLPFLVYSFLLPTSER